MRIPHTVVLVALILAVTSLCFAAPIVNSTSPSSGPVGTQVQINGSGFGTTQGSSAIAFNSVNAAVVSWSDTQIVATVPTTATTGPVKVTVGGVASNTTVYFDVPMPYVASVTPTSGVIGTQITVSGSAFQATKGSNYIKVGGQTATVSTWSDTQIVATVSNYATTGPVQVYVNGIGSNPDVIFTLPNPVIAGLNPSSAQVGAQIQVNGSGFGATQGSSTVTFNGYTATVASWADNQIVVTVPAFGYTSTPVSVTVGGVKATSITNFTVAAPAVTGISPSAGASGTQVTVTGAGFKATKGSNSVTFNGATASVVSWSDTQIVATAPTGTTGPVTVYVDGAASNQNVIFTYPDPVISGLSPTSGPVGTHLQITGTGFGATQGNSTVIFNGSYGGTVLSWADTQIVVSVPYFGNPTGSVYVRVGGVQTTASDTFTLLGAFISGVSPTSGAVGTQVTISGSGFGTTQGSNYVTLNGTTASVSNWSDSQIAATVAAGTTTGPVRAVIGYISSNSDVVFTMPNPVVSTLSPQKAPVSSPVQVNGSGFGASQGGSTVTFNGTTATASSWSDTQITATVPSGATSGYVRVAVGGVTSATNSANYFTVGNLLVTGISPIAGPVGTQITVSGVGFGASQGSSTISINNVSATVSSWSDTQIIATVPSGATTGAVKVVNGGFSSNTDITFTVDTVAVTSITPTSGPVGTQVQINGTGFGSSQGSSTVTFNNSAGTVVSWSATQIVATVPTSATTGGVKVTVGGVASNTNVIYTVPPPHVGSLSPTSGVVGTQVTVAGSGFQATKGSSYLTFNGYSASVVSWSDTQIVATVPSSATTGPVQVYVNGVVSNQDAIFAMPNPTVTTLSPSSGVVGTQVQINGRQFGATQGSSTITFNYVTATVVSWSDTQIVATVPTTATTGAVKVTVGGVSSNTNVYFVIPAPSVTSLSPNSGVVGTQVTVNGSGFQATKGSSYIQFNGYSATVASWSDTQIVATVPASATTGPVRVYVNGIGSNQDVYFAMPSPMVSWLSPATGPVGTQVQINGSGFGASQGGSTITFNGYTPTVVTWSDTQIVATVPSNATSGAVKVTVGGVPSNSNVNFTVPAPYISGISPSSGPVGTQVNISGSGFQATQGSSGVSFNSAGGTIVSWSDTSIVATVPANATTGAVWVTVNSRASNQNNYFTLPDPLVDAVSPGVGPVGTQVTVSGTGFGATQGSSTITFNSRTASVLSWADTQITAVVPTTATTGPIRVSVGGVLSNSTVYFTVPPPHIDALSPNIGGDGNPVTITGSGFQATKGGSYVQFSVGAAAITSWSDTQIVATVPSNAVTGSVTVVVNSVASNPVTYTVPSLVVSSVSPTSGTVGTQVTVNGNAFGSSQGTSTLTFNGAAATSISSWSNTQIVATVPVTATTGPVQVVVNNIESNATVSFTVPPPNVSSVSPGGGPVGTQVTITGSGFQANQRDSVINFNGIGASVASWSDTQIVAAVPTSATTGPVTVVVNGIQSNTSVSYTVPYPAIDSLAPPSGAPGGSVTINGSGFGTSQTNTQVQFNGLAASVSSWGNTSIVAVVPANVTSGPVTVTMWGVVSNGVNFTVDGAPTITSLTPAAGPIGSSVTVTGMGFGASQSNSTIDFNGIISTPTSWTDTQIVAPVPQGTTSGPLTVKVASLSTQSEFTINSTVGLGDSAGNQSSYTAAMVGGIWRISDVSGSGCATCTMRGLIHNQFDNNGYLLSTTDALGHTTTYTYDSKGNVASISRQLDGTTTATTSYTYNSFGEVLTVADPLGNLTTNQYDANGNLTSITLPAPGGGAGSSVTQFAYDTKGELTQITDPLGHLTTITYTPAGLIATITDAQQNVTSYQYDPRGNRTAVIDASQHQTSFAYDFGNRLTGIVYPDSTSVGFGYDSRGRRTSVTDQNGRTTSYAYDDADRLVAVTDAAMNATQYAYDLESNLVGITDAKGHTTGFAYDAYGRVIQTSFPSSFVETYGYDAVGNLTSKTDRKGQTISYVYDALSRLVHKGYPDSTGVDYVYDLVGKIRQVSDPTGTYGFAYDNMGRLIGTTTQYSFLPNHTFSNTYAYDAASNRVSLSADGTSTTYAYDTLNRMTDLTSAWAGHFSLGYDSLSRRTGLNRPNGINTSYSYDSVSHLLSVLHQAGGGTIDGAGYAYDAAGNRTSNTNYLNSTSEQYTYDAIYQLTQVTTGESYTYDAVGNRLSSAGVPTYSYNAANELTSTTAATFAYDYNGNTTSKTDATGTMGYAWDLENRLTSVTLPNNGGVVTFKYDPFGRRIQKIGVAATSVYAYDGANIVGEYDGAGNAVALYAQGAGIDEPLAMSRAGAISYYEADGLGSVTSLTDSTGSAVAAYTRDNFGKALTTADTIGNRFRYTAREWDDDSGIYFYRARYYDPSSGRFLSEDPFRFLGGRNFYTYVGNSPISLVDPFGLAEQCKRKRKCRLGERLFLGGKGLGNIAFGTGKIFGGATIGLGGAAETGGLSLALGFYGIWSGSGNIAAGSAQLAGAFTCEFAAAEEASNTSGVFTTVFGMGTLVYTGGNMQAASTAANIEGLGLFGLSGGLGEPMHPSDLWDLFNNTNDLVNGEHQK